MSQKFNRKVSVTIFKDGIGFTIDKLRIVFEIVKDQLGYPGLAKIDIYNLTRDNQNRIKDVFDKVIVNAGYGDSEGQIFEGDLRNVIKVRQGVDMITRIWAASNDVGIKQGFLNYTAGDNTTINEIIEKAAESFAGVVVGRIDDLIGSNKIKGETFSGSTRQILDRLKNDYGFNWFVEDNKLHVLKPDSTLNTEQTAIIISSTTGMIGPPAITERGVMVKTLLDHTIKIGRLIKIKSQTATVQLGNLFFRNIDRTIGEGSYKTIKVTHSGDTHSNTWYSTVEALTI